MRIRAEQGRLRTVDSALVVGALAMPAVAFAWAPSWLALDCLLIGAVLIGYATTRNPAAGTPAALRLAGGVETFALTFAFGYALLVALRPGQRELGQLFYDGFIHHTEAAWRSFTPWRHPGAELTYLIVGVLVVWVVVVNVRPYGSLAWLAPAVVVDLYLLWLMGRMLVQPVRGVPPIGIFEGGSYANLGVFTLAALGGLTSLRLVSVIGRRNRLRVRLSTVQAGLTIGVCVAALVLLGRYVHRLGLTPPRLAGFVFVGALLALALAHLLTGRRSLPKIRGWLVGRGYPG